MDRRGKKQEQTEKKLKDRGDLKKITIKKLPEDNHVKKIFADRGDSNSKTLQKQNGVKLNVDGKFSNVPKVKEVSNATVGRLPDRSTERVGQKQAVSNLDIRRLIRERYTLRSNAREENSRSRGLVKSDRRVNRSRKQLTEDTTIHAKEKPTETHTADVLGKKTEKDSTAYRKPIIKTVTTRNITSNTYKTVTFGEQKTQLRPLQVKIPSGINRNSKDVDTITLKPRTVSRASVKDKPEIRKYIRKRPKKFRHASSPDSFKVCDNKSPPTEVAKWAPSSINRHTKPYYEAWVNTTLAAISKGSQQDKMFLEKRSVLQSFQRALEERADSPELIYEKLLDERYTGRIRVIHR